MSDDTGQEPSMEEILASIRKIISEDGEDTEEDEVTEPEPEPAPAPEGNDAIELTDQVVPPPPAELEEITLIDEVVEDDVLVSAATTAVGASAFAQLTGAMDLAMRLGGVDRTLEALVKELMRPMLRDWLEANLPAVVERLVQREIDKMSVKSGDD
jgi:cell pole-organizing protein PopZ